MRAWLDDGGGDGDGDGAPAVVHGDPSRLHHDGATSRVALEGAREQVAAAVGARPREVVFTSGATESIAASTFGARARADGDHIVLAAVEHSAVREWAERGPHTVVDVDRTGRVDADDLLAAVGDDVAVMRWLKANPAVGLRLELSTRGDRRPGLAIAVPWKSDDLQAWLNLCIDKCNLDGTLKTLVNNHLGDPLAR